MPRVFRLTDALALAGPTGRWRAWYRAARAAALIHADGPAAARIGALLARLTERKLVVSGAARTSRPGWLTRRALCRADRLVARTPAEAGRYRAAGAAEDRILLVPPGVAPAPAAPDPDAFRRDLALPASARLILAAGSFQYDLIEAVWAFDLLKYLAPDLFLVVIGDGPERARIERFGRTVGFDDYRIRYLGERADRAALFGLATVVWVGPDRELPTIALEALASARPVVAFDDPDLAGLIEDGITGRIVPANDRIRMAGVTAALLGRPEEQRALAEAGRARAATFPASVMAERWTALYHGLVTARR